jgi:hypothetical protein
MCTVTYLPSNEGFILTHNRDEAPARSPQNLDTEKRNADTLLFPRDTGAGGSWIACAESGKLACVLNGAFIKHKHRPPYRRSRGLLLLDLFDAADSHNFLAEHPLDGIEPFTMLFFDEKTVMELRWDGSDRFLKSLAQQEPHFWCSATLYPPEMQVRREDVFRQWLDAETWTPEAALQLHLQGSVGDPENDFVMNRNNIVRTVSITQVLRSPDQFDMNYRELLRQTERRQQLPLRSENAE